MANMISLLFGEVPPYAISTTRDETLSLQDDLTQPKCVAIMNISRHQLSSLCPLIHLHASTVRYCNVLLGDVLLHYSSIFSGGLFKVSSSLAYQEDFSTTRWQKDHKVSCKQTKVPIKGYVTHIQNAAYCDIDDLIRCL